MQVLCGEINRVCTDPGKSWNLKTRYFPGLKVMENQPNSCHFFDPCTCFWPLYTLSLSMGQLRCRHIIITWNLVNVTNIYAAQSCNFNGHISNRHKLSWKFLAMHIKCLGELCKTSCSVLYAPWGNSSCLSAGAVFLQVVWLILELKLLNESASYSTLL